MSNATTEPMQQAKEQPQVKTKKKSRRNSGALMELKPQDWNSNPSFLRKFHDLMYPESKYYWYRRGKVRHTDLTSKYLRFLLMSFALGLSQAWLKGIYEWQSTGYAPRNLTMLISNLNPETIATMSHSEFPVWVSLCAEPWFVAFQMILSGLATSLVYYMGAMYLVREYYTNQKDVPQEWKCQPDAYLAPERATEERRLGCFNAFVAGFLGTGLYFSHINKPWLKLYYQTGPEGLGYFFASAGFLYLWIDFYSYWVHRFLHVPFMYKNIHKMHHRYVHPTPFSAFALHPLEMVMFQSAAVIMTAIIPMHIMAFLFVVLYIAMHNQLDHSGIDFEGDLPWMPSTKYHDDHHLYFHLNFGLHLVMWDWLGGSLRSKERSYGEDLFLGMQDAGVVKSEGGGDATVTSKKMD